MGKLGEHNGDGNLTETSRQREETKAQINGVLPMRDIHAKMVSEGETAQNIYSARIATLRAEIQTLLDANQVEEAKAVQEKKALVETF